MSGSVSGSSRRKSRSVRRLSLLGAALAVAAIAATSTSTNAQASATGPTETCTTPAVSMYQVDSTAQLVRWGFSAPLTGKPGWAGEIIGARWSGLDVVSGGDGVIYTIDSSGNLRWYSDGDYAGGAPDWASNSGALIGTGWNVFRTVISGGDGVFYGVDAAGNLHWYRNLSTNGAVSWAPNSGKIIGTGWNGPVLLAAGGDGVIFAVAPSGTLTWYRHLDPMGGSVSWANGGNGAAIGSGWAAFTRLASMGGGVLLARDQQGILWWYRDTDPLGGTFSWARGGNGIPEDSGWSNNQLVTDIDGCSSV